MSSDLRDIRPSTGLLMGSLFLVSGLAIVFVGLGWVQVDPATIHAPGWVLGVCGGIFGLLGAGILYYAVVNASGGGDAGAAERAEEEFSVVPWLLGLVVVGGMTAVASWIAFGPGERSFSGSVGIGGVSVGGSGGSETVGRWVFGVGAVLAGLFTLWGLVYGLRRLAARFRSRGP